MTGNNPMSFFSDNVDAWGPLEWFDRLAKAVHARSRAGSEKDDLSFELYQNIASSSATRLVSDFEDKVRMALTTLRELEKANVAYVDANTELLSTLEALQRENEELRNGPPITGKWKDDERAKVWEYAFNKQHTRAEAAEAKVKRYRKALIAAKTRMRNCRGAIESDQVVDKDVHGSLQNGIRDIQEALASTGGEHNAE